MMQPRVITPSRICDLCYTPQSCGSECRTLSGVLRRAAAAHGRRGRRAGGRQRRVQRHAPGSRLGEVIAMVPNVHGYSSPVRSRMLSTKSLEWQYAGKQSWRGISGRVVTLARC